MIFCKICLKKINTAKNSENSDYHDACKKKLFGKAGISPTLSFNKKEFSGDIARQFTKRMSMSGLQQKLSMKIEHGTIQPTDVGGTHILKPTAHEYDFVSENEHASMIIGSNMGIETPPCGLISFSNGELAYIVKRFDREKDTKIPQEDLAQIMGLLKDSTDEFKYEGSYEQAGKAILKATGNKLAIVFRFFERVVFNFLIGNSEYHLKNISLRKIDTDGFYGDLTPNYDSINTLIHLDKSDGFFALKNGLFDEHYEREPYLSFGFPTESDFFTLGERLGLNKKIIQETLTKFDKKIPEMRATINASYLPVEKQNEYIAALDNRAKMLKTI